MEKTTKISIGLWAKIIGLGLLGLIILFTFFPSFNNPITNLRNTEKTSNEFLTAEELLEEIKNNPKFEEYFRDRTESNKLSDSNSEKDTETRDDQSADGSDSNQQDAAPSQKGADGKPGIAGVNGRDGARGPKGESGSSSNAGSKGDKGDKGDDAVITDDSIESRHIVDGTITSSDLATGSVTTIKIADGNVTSIKIADGAVTTDKLGDNSVSSAKIIDANITTSKLANGSVTNEKLADDAVTEEKLATDSVTSIKIANSSVTNAKLANGSVDTNKLADDAGDEAKLADGAVATAKLANSAVTTVKIADGNVTTIKLADHGVTTDKLADASVTLDKLADEAVSTAKLADGSVATDKVGNKQITKAKVADDTLDFDVFADAMTIDAKTTLASTDSNFLEFSRSSGGRFLSFNDGTDSHSYMSGQGTPEGNQTADAGSLYVDTTNAKLFIKNSDGSNTGWSNIRSSLQPLATTANPNPAKVGNRYIATYAAAGDFTLPSYSGLKLGDQIELVNTNGTAITVNPQTGQSLNGANNGTNLSNVTGGRTTIEFNGTDWSVYSPDKTVPLHFAALRRIKGNAQTVNAPVNFPTTDTNTGGIVTNATTVTIAQSGKYAVAFHGDTDYTEGTGGERYIHIVKNNTSPANEAAARASSIVSSESYSNSKDNGVFSHNPKTIVDLSAGDTIIVYYHTLIGSDKLNNATLTVQQLASKSIVNIVDAPVNDQSGSGYYDVGNVRTQWGTASAAYGNNFIINLPASFANTNYSVTATASKGHHTVSILNTLTPTFSIGIRDNNINNWSPSNDTDIVRWQAVGIKP